MQDWIFGIDGGGTGSRIRVEGIDGSTLYAGTAGSTNLNSNGASYVKEQLRILFDGAYAAGIQRKGCAAGFIGSAGAGRPAERAALTGYLAEHAPGAARLAAGNDAETALAGALRDVEGYVLIAGTGSIALARSPDGETCRAGGWGHWLGDEGSAFWIAFEAVKRGIRASEGRDAPTALADAALAFFGIADYQELVTLVYGKFDKAAIARFSLKVEELRALGDAAATEIFDRAASELAKLAASVYGSFKERTSSRRVALCGGLLEENNHLRTLVESELSRTCPVLVTVRPAGDAQAGACLLARSLLSD